MVNRKELKPDSSPQAAYGARLREMRERRGWTQNDLAAELECSSQHVSAVETARKSPTLLFSRRVDNALGLAETTESFEREWREIRHGSLLEGFAEYVAKEARAVEIRLYEIGIIPGLLQTPEYAQALVDSAVHRGAITPEQGAERLSVIADRQRARPSMLMVVMDESCIRRTVGGPEVMRAQLERLLEFAALPNTVLQVAPFGIGERRTFNLPLNLLTLADMSVIAYAESQIRGHLERDNKSVLPMLTAYHQLQAEALPQSASVAMINEVRKGTL